MAWRRPGDKPLTEPMMVRLPTHICVFRPQRVNTYHAHYISLAAASMIQMRLLARLFCITSPIVSLVFTKRDFHDLNNTRVITHVTAPSFLERLYIMLELLARETKDTRVSLYIFKGENHCNLLRVAKSHYIFAFFLGCTKVIGWVYCPSSSRSYFHRDKPNDASIMDIDRHLYQFHRNSRLTAVIGCPYLAISVQYMSDYLQWFWCISQHLIMAVCQQSGEHRVSRGTFGSYSYSV